LAQTPPVNSGLNIKFPGCSGCAEASTSSCAKNEEEAEKLWRWSCSKTRLPLDL